MNWRLKAAQKIDSRSPVYEHASNLGEVMVMKELDPSSSEPASKRFLESKAK